MYDIIINEDKQTLQAYQDQFLLIINIANECGYNKQLGQLQALHANPGIPCSIIAFPCNQFGNQQSLTHQEMLSWCQQNYQTTFPIEAIIEVNGPKAHPLYQYLTKRAPGALGQKKIMWNFTKFLIHPQAEHIKRFAPSTEISKIEEYINQLTT